MELQVFFFFFEKENCKSLDIDYIDCGFKVWYIDLLVQAWGYINSLLFEYGFAC